MKDDDRRHEKWARFRFAVVGPLLACPPAHGQLRAQLEALAQRTYTHPVTGVPTCFAFKTIEQWFYSARKANDPVASLRRKVRRDVGKRRSLSDASIAAICAQYAQHPRWSYQLHYDNLAALCRKDPGLGKLPAYSTVRRFMKSRGMVRIRRKIDVKIARSPREVRSFEADYVNGLWHLDFHHGRKKVLLPNATWVTPKMLAVLDDRSRLCCHAQWYLSETTEALVHALSQAILKRGLPRALMSDNGSAMISAETTEGLARLSIIHFTTLVESPYQNGKQEVFFAPVEGRLISMLEGVEDLTLKRLNEATQAWVELEHNRENHSELGCAPIERFAKDSNVARDAPSIETLTLAFCQQVRRTQRRSDGTITVEGVRFELPGRYRHLHRVAVRYKSWDLSRLWLVDSRLDKVLCPLYPLDRSKNADGHRRPLEPINVLPQNPASDVAPLLRELIAEYAATGLPPAYLPLDEQPQPEDKDES